MEIRPAAGAADTRHVRDLVDRAFTLYIPRLGHKPKPMTADYDTIVASGRCWVAVDAGEIVGMLHLETAGDHLEVETVAVAPGAQARGVGGRLLAFAEQRALDHGLPEVRLCTSRTMTENIAYYPRRGYRETHRDADRVFFAKTV
ncbi:MAG: GNAT family N-acetyltransferase [Actinomycetota bacterium]|nr:GNAT family N-acetyltransferase [Actinomycetota bacterium]